MGARKTLIEIRLYPAWHKLDVESAENDVGCMEFVGACHVVELTTGVPVRLNYAIGKEGGTLNVIFSEAL